MPMQLLERLCSADMPVTIDVHEDIEKCDLLRAAETDRGRSSAVHALPRANNLLRSGHGDTGDGQGRSGLEDACLFPVELDQRPADLEASDAR